MRKSRFAFLMVIVILCVLVLPAFAAELDEGIPLSITGELTILQVDDFDRGIAKTIYHLRDPRTNKTFTLRFTGEPPGRLRTGAIVSVRGKAKGEQLLLADGGAGQIEILDSGAPAVAGEQKTIVMVSNFLDQTVSCFISDVQNRVFTDPSNRSIDDLYQEMSFGQVWFAGGVAGPYVINYSSTSSCNISAWASATDAAAQASGINLSSYNRKVYVMPRNNPCGYLGVGTVGGNPSRSWIFWCEESDFYAHELGHNLGMNHASTPTDEYGDTSDIMGYGGYGLRQISAPHQHQMGWLDPLQIEGIVESGTYTIAPLELNPSQATAPQILVIPKPDTGESYYLSYRQAIGFDANLESTYFRGVNIHRHKPDSALRTYLLNVLADGGSFTDSVNGVTLTQTGHTEQDVTVQIHLNGTPVCTSNAPTMTISPTSQSAQAGSILTYSVSVTNMDSANCSQTTFSLTDSLPAGWTGSLSPTSLALAPGASGSSTLSVRSSDTAAVGDYALTVQASDGALPIHTISRSATYTVLPKPVCIPASPTLSLSPTKQSSSPGTTLAYSVSLSNMDNANCSQTTFSLTSSLPSTWTGSFSPSSLTLVPGASGSSTLSVKSSTTAAPGDYSFTATASDTANSSHSSSGIATYTVTVLSDAQPPTAPTSLTAKVVRGKVNLSWTASTDNVGVSGYNVWRNNVVIGQTASTSFSDSSVKAGQTYTYFVTASDAAGNVSAKSNQVTVGGVKRRK